MPLNQDSEGARKGYGLRFGNLSRAWEVAEANAGAVLKSYREEIDNIQALAEAQVVVAKRRSQRKRSPSV